MVSNAAPDDHRSDYAFDLRAKSGGHDVARRAYPSMQHRRRRAHGRCPGDTSETQDRAGSAGAALPSHRPGTGICAAPGLIAAHRPGHEPCPPQDRYQAIPTPVIPRPVYHDHHHTADPPSGRVDVDFLRPALGNDHPAPRRCGGGGNRPRGRYEGDVRVAGRRRLAARIGNRPRPVLQFQKG